MSTTTPKIRNEQTPLRRVVYMTWRHPCGCEGVIPGDLDWFRLIRDGCLKCHLIERMKKSECLT